MAAIAKISRQKCIFASELPDLRALNP